MACRVWDAIVPNDNSPTCCAFGSAWWGSFKTFTSYSQTLVCVLRRRNSKRFDGTMLSSCTFYYLARQEARTADCSCPCCCETGTVVLLRTALTDFPGKGVVESGGLTQEMHSDANLQNRHCWCQTCNRVAKSKVSSAAVSNRAKPPFKR